MDPIGTSPRRDTRANPNALVPCAFRSDLSFTLLLDVSEVDGSIPTHLEEARNEPSPPKQGSSLSWKSSIPSRRFGNALQHFGNGNDALSEKRMGFSYDASRPSKARKTIP